MAFCVLFILWSGTGHVTPNCYVDGVYVTPQDVVYVSQIPAPFWRFAHEAPLSYTAYYAQFARDTSYHRYAYVYTPTRVYPHWHYRYRYRQYRRPYRWGFWHHKHPRRSRRVAPRHYKKHKKYTPVRHKRRPPAGKKYKKHNKRRKKR